MDGWCSVEELTQWGFAQAPVLMANEAHNGLKRCVRTRVVGTRMVRAAHEAGVRRLACRGDRVANQARSVRFRRSMADIWASRTCAR